MITHVCHLPVKETGERSAGKQRDRQRYEGLRFSDTNQQVPEREGEGERGRIILTDKLITSLGKFVARMSLQSGSAVINHNIPTVL